MDLIDMLKNDKKLLVVSLPENSLKYAQTAFENGADAVKLHANVRHRVTKKLHSSWIDVQKIALEIIEKLDIPVGIVPGADLMASEEEMHSMEKTGISFFDVYIDYAPLYVLKNGMVKMLALNHTYSLDMVKDLEKVGADCIEISIIDPEKYGADLTIMDILKYTQIIQQTKLPAFVPTQKKIKPEEVPQLLDLGLKGLIIGPVVTGTEIDEFSRGVKAFSKAIHEYKGR